jgi:hypothetical protein
MYVIGVLKDLKLSRTDLSMTTAKRFILTKKMDG